MSGMSGAWERRPVAACRRSSQVPVMVSHGGWAMAGARAVSTSGANTSACGQVRANSPTTASEPPYSVKRSCTIAMRGEVIGSSPVGVRPCGIGGSTALSPSRQPRREGGRVEPSWLGARTQGGGDRAAFEQSVDAALIQGARVDGGGGAAGVEGVVDVGVGVGGGGDERLPEHAVSDQFLEDQGAQRLGGLPVGVEGLEDQAGGAARDAQVVADAEFAGDLLESGAQTFTRGFHAA